MYLNIRSYLMAMGTAVLVVSTVAIVLGTLLPYEKEIYTAAVSFMVVR